MFRSIERCGNGLLIALVLAMIGGCGGAPKMQKLNLGVERQDVLQDRSVEVHLVGVNGAELGEWQSNTADKYWESGNQLRLNADSRGLIKKVTEFRSNGTLGPVWIPPDDPIWAKWQEWGAMNVFIYAQNVGLGAGAARQVVKELPIDSDSYGSRQQVRIQIMGSQITLNPAPNSSN